MRHTEDVSWRLRLSTTVIFVGYALALIVSFYISVDALIHRDGFERATFVGSLLSASLLILVAAPLSDIAFRTNPEVRTVIQRLPPWSRWRRQRRELRAARKESMLLRDDIDVRLRQREALLRQTREAIAEAEKYRERLDAMRRFHAALPPDMHVDPQWAEVELAAEEAEIEVLRPGSTLGRLEFGLETALLERADALALRGKVERLIRRIDIRFKGHRLFRFDHFERTNFRRQIASLHDEFGQLPTP